MEGRRRHWKHITCDWVLHTHFEGFMPSCANLPVLLTITDAIVISSLIIGKKSIIDHFCLQVSYGYLEQDDIQMDNFNFFLRAGKAKSPTGQGIHFVFVINGASKCTPCDILFDGSSEIKA